MAKLKFNFTESGGVGEEELKKAGERLAPEIERVAAARETGYDTQYASINLPEDSELLSRVEETLTEKRKLGITALVVIGIGGSNLGTQAVYEAVNGRGTSNANQDLKVFFADTVDSDKVRRVLSETESILAEGGSILVNVVTKSGTTTETIALYELFEGILKKHKGREYIRYVVATTGIGSPLWEYATKKGFSLLEIPGKVGGRYSVLSAVGLFPLGFAGIDLAALRRGAASIIPACIGDVKKNPAAKSAITLHEHSRQGRRINDNFIFSTDLEAAGKWYRQLMGESIGKKWDASHTRQVNAGITPTVSIGSTDLHSMAQLYLGGPDDKITTFIRVEENNSSITLPENEEINELVESIQGKPMKEIMNAIYSGVKHAYREKGRPYMEVTLKEKSAETVGALLQFKMIEMMYLGFLLNVNPFDQPNVEAYKKETRRILSDE